MIKGALFDFRDTLLDVSESRNATNLLVYGFARAKGAVLSPEEFQVQLSAAAGKIIAKFQRSTSIHNWNLLIVSQFLGGAGVKFEGKEFQHLMEKHDAIFIDKAKLYPDALPLLELLKFKEIKMGVVIDGTTKRERAILKKLDLEKYLRVVVISEEVGQNKLGTAPLQKALASMSLPHDEVVVVGDRLDKDVEPANKLGCVSVRLIRSTGRYAERQPANQNEKPRYTINTLTQLAELID